MENQTVNINVSRQNENVRFINYYLDW